MLCCVVLCCIVWCGVLFVVPWGQKAAVQSSLPSLWLFLKPTSKYPCALHLCTPSAHLLSHRSFFFAVFAIRASTILHKHLIESILRVALVFFESTPLGRVLNRFSKVCVDWARGLFLRSLCSRPLWLRGVSAESWGCTAQNAKGGQGHLKQAL